MDWLKAFFALIASIFKLGREVKQALPPSAPGKVSLMSTISVAQLKSLAGVFGDAKTKSAVQEMCAGKLDGFLLGAEEVASGVGIFWPPAGMIAQGLEVAREVAPVVEALIARGVIKGHNSGEVIDGVKVGADPAGSSINP